MEAHHTQPLAEIEEDDASLSIDDLALLCANCHRMLHRHKPWLTVEQLREILRRDSL
jgi:predicted HNH restriction endonuclease